MLCENHHFRTSSTAVLDGAHNKTLGFTGVVVDGLAEERDAPTDIYTHPLNSYIKKALLSFRTVHLVDTPTYLQRISRPSCLKLFGTSRYQEGHVKDVN